jgi:cytochrome P450
MTTPTSAPSPRRPFNIEDMNPSGPFWPIIKRLLEEPQWWMGLLRRFWPIPHLPWLRFAMVTRFEHVREVLDRDQVFQVPFAPRMMDLMPGPLFVLAMQDGDDYREQRRQIMHTFRLEDIPQTVAPRAAALAEQIVAGCGGRIDAIEGLLTRVPTLLCREYYGVDFPEAKLFAEWLSAISSYMFSPPSDKPDPLLPMVREAADGVRAAMDQAIRDAKKAPASDATIVARLVQMQRRGGGAPSDELIRAELLGMLAGFVPTNTIASGNMLEMLLRREDIKTCAEQAARDDDDGRLWRCLYEALRFRPINLGPFRTSVADYTIAEGSSREKRIPAGTRVLASTQSAMFDERGVVEPKKFNPDRPAHESMVFGYGLHWCIGTFLAKAQITQTFKPLLKRGIRRANGSAGRLRTIGLMPAHLTVEF